MSSDFRDWKGKVCVMRDRKKDRSDKRYANTRIFAGEREILEKGSDAGCKTVGSKTRTE